jgi:hypothetical protein
MRKTYGQLRVGDLVFCRLRRDSDRYAQVTHVSSGGQVYVVRWLGKSGRWGPLERLSAEDFVCETSRDEFYEASNRP